MSNIAFNEKSFQNITDKISWDTMSVEWSIRKSFLLVLITFLSAMVTWFYEPIQSVVLPYYLAFIIAGFITALIIIFKKKTAPYLAPVYAILEWVILWAVSFIYEVALPGIVMQAVGLTFAIFFIMLGLYASKIITVTQKFRMWVVACTWAIAFMYILSLLWSFTGWFSMDFLHSSWPIGIWISIFIVWIAAFNLALDFDTIETWAKANAPKYYEWFAAFGLLVTLVWLYLEVLRLLSKIRSR